MGALELGVPARARPRAAAAVAGVGARRRRAVRLSRAVTSSRCGSRRPPRRNCVNYFWPLFIVLVSALLPNERLKPHHIIGALIALGGHGCAVLRPRRHHVRGRIPAGLCLRVRCGDRVGDLLGARRAALLPCRPMRSRAFVLRRRCWRRSSTWRSRRRSGRRRPGQWLAVLALGIGPVGAAFYVWDIGMKRGDIRILGVASYLAPLLSTGYLVLAGLCDRERLARHRGGADRGWRTDRREGYDEPEER